MQVKFNHTAILINIIIIILSFSAVMLYLNFGYPNSGTSNNVEVNALSNIYEPLFIWQPSGYSGILTTLGSSITYLFGLLELFGVFGGTFLNLFVPVAIVTTGMFNLIYFLTPKSSKRVKLLYCFTAAILIMFNFLYIRNISWFALTPWSILLLSQLLAITSNKSSRTNMYLFLSTLVIATGLSFAGFLAGVQFLTLLLFFGIALILLSNEGMRKRKFFALSFVIALTLAINAPLISSTYLISTISQNPTSNYQTVLSGNTNLITKATQNNFIIELSSFMTDNVDGSSIYYQLHKVVANYSALLGIAFILFIISGFSVIVRAKARRVLKRYTFESIFVSLLTLILLFTLGLSYNLPFGKVFSSVSSAIYNITHLNFLLIHYKNLGRHTTC